MRRTSLRCELWMTLLATAAWSGPAAADYTYQEFNVPDAAETAIYGINDNGVIVGEYGDDVDVFNFVNTFGNVGFIYDGSILTTVSYPNSIATSVSAINNSNVVVGSYFDENAKARGYVYDGVTYKSILPFGTAAEVTGINDQGNIVGIYSTDGFQNDLGHGFIGTLGPDHNYTFSSFDFPTALITHLTDVNNGGEMIGTYTRSTGERLGFTVPGFRSVAFENNTDLPTFFSGMNDQGQVVGNYIYLVDPLSLQASRGAFIYKRNGTVTADDFVHLDLPGATCTFNLFQPDGTCWPTVRGINNAGTIVGFYDNDDGDFRGFIGTPDTNPAADGDYDANGVVNGNDFLVWQRSFGSANAAADGDGNGQVNAADLAIWGRKFGEPLASAANHHHAHATPEPASLTMLATACLISAALLRRR